MFQKKCIFASQFAKDDLLITKMKQRIIIAISGWLAALTLAAQPLCHVTYYDEEDGLPHGHATQLLQDQKGLMWFSTWNGLCRYDGYEFRTFKPQAGDGCNMATDRIRMFAMRPDGNFICRIDEDFFLFNTRTYQFSNLPQAGAEEEMKRYRTSMSLRENKPIEWKDGYGTHWTLYADGQLTYQREDGQAGNYPLDIKLKKLSFACQDRQGNLWVLGNGNGVYKFTTDLQRTWRLPIEPQAQVKCLFKDSRQRLWVATREDKTVRLYDANSMQLLGFLGADGRLHQQYTRFGAAVYCMYQSKDGTLWLGTKPQGIYRLKETAAGTFHIDHLTQLPNLNVYNILEDWQGRLWVATLGGGLCYAQQPQAANPQFVVPKGYPKDVAQRVRFLTVTQTQQGQVLLAATTEGLMVCKLEQQANRMHFRLHQREANRAQSLSSSATMDIMRAPDDRLYVSTESGGLNRIEDNDLLKEQLAFRHYTAQNNLLPTDVVQSMVSLQNGKCAIVSSHLISIIDGTKQYRQLDARYFNADYRFSDAHPQQVGDNRWIFGLNDGAFLTSIQQMQRPAYQPQMVLTNLVVRGEQSEVRDCWSIEQLDTLSLQPHERNITLHFAAIDYQAAECIGYAFRLLNDGQRDTTQWNYIGTNRSVTLLDLEPGTYRLEVRSTNADGEWLNNQRVLTVIVQPTFWEAWYGQLLLVIIVIAVVAAVIYTLLYIRRIKRQQRETLEKYLALMEGTPLPSSPMGEGMLASLSVSPSREDKSEVSLDPMLQRVMQFVEENIANSDVNVGDMASAAAVSRSGLQRKVKQAMGITPQDLLREARIKRACQLLRQTDKTVAEVAYACGFSDPKYFSRSFKQSTGLSPTEYKTQA